MRNYLIYWVVACSWLFVACRNTLDEPAAPSAQDVFEEDSMAIVPDCAIGFLSVYPTPNELVEQGDDDEASAWLWLHATYPEAQYVYFGSIGQEQSLASYKVLFWLRDVESGQINDVVTMPSVVTNAIPQLKTWYKQGGNLMLWGHAVLLTEALERLPKGTYTASSHEWVCGCDSGFLDHATWLMATQLHPGGMFKKDHSTHPLFDGIAIYSDANIRGICVKGPGWTENHNCVFFNYPAELTGRQWQTEICYDLLTSYYGICPLAVWDSQTNWVSQLNVYELRKGNTDNLGTILCIGNGGCDFSMKSYQQVGVDASNAPIWRVTADKSAYPTNNCYQGNILRMAKNGIEYLRRL